LNPTYDKYYQTKNLFGEAYPELLEFFSKSSKGKVLDLGCGQGRDAIPLARLGFDVTAIDNSHVGIEQMNTIAQSENLKLKGVVTDIFEFDEYADFDFLLLDSMFHFQKNHREKEVSFIENIFNKIKIGCQVVFCIQDSSKKVEILKDTITSFENLKLTTDQKFEYIFKDSETNHQSNSGYRMVVVKK
jgi:2-polyprenyl-3-methyl-5-hydroxy-6-metoxy-1,4-benzoquinol methylase